MDQGRDISHFSLIDWDFPTEDSKVFLHDLCWYPAKFVPILPAHIIQALSYPGDTVLDPFCGSGTTVIETLKLGRNAIGIDINPVACFIANTKVSILRRSGIDLGILQEFADDLATIAPAMRQVGNPDARSLPGIEPLLDVQEDQIPNHSENSQWYEQTTLKMLGYIHGWLEGLPSGPTKDVSRLLFISILMPSSGHTLRKPYTYFADNCKPKELKYKNAISLYLGKLNGFLSSFAGKSEGDFLPHAEVIHDDIKNLRTVFECRDQVDIVVTSPPYLGVTDYTMAYRLTYLWDYFASSVADTRKQEIGARYRRRVLGCLEDYLEALKKSIEDMVAVLKENGYLCLVLGEPKKYHEVVLEALMTYATDVLGLHLTKVFTRTINKKFFIHPEGGVLSEDILIFQKRG